MGLSISPRGLRPGAPDQGWFRRFPIQAALLFRPDDLAFMTAVRERFDELDHSSGLEVVLFTPLNPPAAGRPRPRSRGRRATLTSWPLSFDEPVLLHQLD